MTSERTTTRHFAGADGRGELLLLTPEEAARRLSIGRTRLYNLLRTGQIASIRIGGSRRITPDALDGYVNGITGRTASRQPVPSPQLGAKATRAPRRTGRQVSGEAVSPVSHNAPDCCEPLQLHLAAGD